MDDDKIVNLNEVIKRIALLSDVDEETSKEFIQAFSRVLVDALLSKDSVDIRAIGRFSEDEHVPGNVRFEASLPLASVVNRPFSCFDPVELDDESDDIENVSSGDVSDLEGSVDSVQDEDAEEDVLPDGMPELPVEVVTQKAEDEKILEPFLESADAGDAVPTEEKHEEEQKPVDESADSQWTETDENKPEQDVAATVRIDNRKPLQVEIVGGEEEKKHHPLVRWIFSLGLVIGLCLGFIAGILLYDYIYPVSQRDIIADEIDDTEMAVIEGDIAAVDDIVAVVGTSSEDSIYSQAENDDTAESVSEIVEPVRESDKGVVTDTVSAGRFLATMARKHYGSYVFWVYIYEENRQLISDPDNVAMGTVVVIPDAAKYGIDAKSPESIKAAKAKAAEIAAERRRLSR